jgi:hypothetical protein
MKLLKRLPLFIVLITVTTVANAQLGVGFYQSNMGSYANVNYQIERLSPELRIGTDNYLESIHLEPVLNYQIIQKTDFSFYAGVGAWIGDYWGIVFPIGVNVFPFENKQFGFHIELTPMYVEYGILRGSWGIRYQFGKK